MRPTKSTFALFAALLLALLTLALAPTREGAKLLKLETDEGGNMLVHIL